MSTLFVAGATGYTGSALVPAGVAAGHRVVAHVRPGSARGDVRAAEFEALGAEVDRSPWEAQAMKAALAAVQPDAVFGLLGTTRSRGKAAAQKGGPAETYETVDRDLSLMLLAAAEAAGSTPRYVFLSSIGADKPRGNAYLRARFQVEEALFAGSLPWTVARPSFISGEDRDESRPGERLGAVVSGAALGLLGALGAGTTRDRYGPITSAELAAGLLRVALDPSMAGRIVDSADLRG